MLQKSLKEFCKTNDYKIKLLRAIVKSLTEVNEYKVQQKWGNELLKSFIDDLRNDPEQKEELETMLQKQMEQINAKNKQYKHNVHMSHGSSGDYYQKSSNYSQGSGGGSGGGFSGQGKPSQARGQGAYDDQYNDQYYVKKKNNNGNGKPNQNKNNMKPMKLK